MLATQIIAIETLCRPADRLRLEDRATLYSQGEPAGILYIIMDGFVKTARICEDGTQVTLEILKRGDIAGTIPVHPLAVEHQNTAWAIGTVTAQKLHAEEFRTAMERHPQLTLFVAEFLARSREAAERRVVRTATQSAHQRVIETLVELARTFGAPCPHGFSLEVKLTQQDIADLVGVSRPVASAILSELRKQGLLDYTREMICVNGAALSLFASPLGGEGKPVLSA